MAKNLHFKGPGKVEWETLGVDWTGKITYYLEEGKFYWRFNAATLINEKLVHTNTLGSCDSFGEAAANIHSQKEYWKKVRVDDNIQ